MVRMPVILACSLGVLVGAVLVSRGRAGSPVLALVGFALLLVGEIGAWLAGVLPLWLRHTLPFRTAATAVGCLSLLFNLTMAAGVVCLVFAVWKAAEK